jgi:hypothetical protein
MAVQRVDWGRAVWKTWIHVSKVSDDGETSYSTVGVEMPHTGDNDMSRIDVVLKRLGGLSTGLYFNGRQSEIT